MAQNSSPSLPVDLVRLILEVAAKEGKSTAILLASISKVVQKWIVPILYHTVTLNTGFKAASFHAALQVSNVNPGESVRCLHIKEQYTWTLRQLFDIIFACTQLQVLVTDACFSTTSVVDRTEQSWPGPWHLVSHSRLESFGHPLLRNITHLYVDALQEEFVPKIPFIPGLSHVGFGCWGDQEPLKYAEWIEHVLSSPSLVMLLLHACGSWGRPIDVFAGERWRSLSEINDDRLLVGRGLQAHEYVLLMESGGTIWDDAEVQYKEWRTAVTDHEP